MEFLPLAPSEWPQDAQKRFQDTIPTIFGCKRAVFQKCLFSYGNPRFLRVGWPSCAVNIPFFRSEAATASHLDSTKKGVLGKHTLEALQCFFAAGGMAKKRVGP